MTTSYQYTTNDHPENPVARVFGPGVEGAVITAKELEELRSCRDFVEEARGAECLASIADRVRELYGADAPVLTLLFA
jgi:hypothetical protein